MAGKVIAGLASHRFSGPTGIGPWVALASEAVLVLLADDSTGLDPHVCRPVVIAAANAEVHPSNTPWACIAVVPLKLAGAVPDDPCG